MALPGVGIFPGRARGAVHLVDDPLGLTSPRNEGGTVLALPALWWPVPEGLSRNVRAVVLQGIPTDRGPEPALPVVGGIDLDVFREDEEVEVDGSEGTVRITGVDEVEVVTAFLERGDGKILLLERSSRVGSFQGRWAGVSGYLEAPTPLEQAYREIREETGFGGEDLVLRAQGAPVCARDGRRVFIVHPFRFRTGRTEVQLDWEHTQAEWVEPSEIRRRPTVPKLDRVWEAVAPPAIPKI